MNKYKVLCLFFVFCILSTFLYAQIDTSWVRRYNGLDNGSDWESGIAVDAQGNVYVAGLSTGISSGLDYAALKYSHDGIQQWLARYTSAGNNFDQIANITLDNSANIYVTGGCWAPATDFDIVTIKYNQAQSIEEENPMLLASGFELQVFPNPASSYFVVRCPSFVNRAEIKIFDVTGKEIKSEEIQAQNCRIQLDGIKNGVYFIAVNGQIVKEKLVIAK